MKSWRRSRPCSRREAKRWPGSRNPVKRLIDLEGKKSRSRSTGTGKSTGKCDDLSDTQTKPLITEVRYVHVSQIVYQQIEQFHQSIQCPVNAAGRQPSHQAHFFALAVVRTYVFSSEAPPICRFSISISFHPHPIVGCADYLTINRNKASQDVLGCHRYPSPHGD